MPPKSAPLVSTLYIVADHGKVLVMEGVQNTISCNTIFQYIEKETGMPQSLQMLSMKGHLLNHHRLLSSYGMEKEYCITLSIKGLGGGKNKSQGESAH